MADAKKDRPNYAVDFVKGDWDKVVYTDNPHIDNLMDALIGLGAEVWALKRRSLIVEKFLAEKHVALKAEIDAYVPNDQERAAWAHERDDFVDRIYSVLTRVTKSTGGGVPTAKIPPINRQ